MNKDDLSWFWVSQRMQLIMCDDTIYSVFPVQIHTMIPKEVGLIFGLDFKSNSETQAGHSGPRGGAQDRIQPTFLQDRQ